MKDRVLLTVDVGNTNVSIGVFDYASDKAELTHHWRMATHREQTSDEVAVMVRALFEQPGRTTDEVTDVILSSVVPPLLPIWERVCTKLFDRPRESFRHLPLLGETEVLPGELKVLVRGSPRLADLVRRNRQGGDQREAAECLDHAGPRLYNQLGELLLALDPGAAPVLFLPMRDPPDGERANNSDHEYDDGTDRKIGHQ